MLCNECNENEAQITYTTIEGNQIKEVHICHSCMQKMLSQELPLPFFQDPHMGNIMQQIFALFVPQSGQNMEDISCPYCGQTLSAFQNSSFLGCQHCYQSFKDELDKIIPRLQGAQKHKGHIPSRFLEKHSQEDSQDNSQGFFQRDGLELAQLKEKLNQAVSQERYEEAAIYRDKIKKWQESGNSHEG